MHAETEMEISQLISSNIPLLSIFNGKWRNDTAGVTKEVLSLNALLISHQSTFGCFRDHALSALVFCCCLSRYFFFLSSVWQNIEGKASVTSGCSCATTDAVNR